MTMPLVESGELASGAADLNFSAESPDWIAVTSRRVLLRFSDGRSTSLAAGEISSAAVETLVGGGRLDIRTHAGQLYQAYFSASLSTRFSQLARSIERLRDGEQPLPAATGERIRCERCRRLLPEPNGLCPRCVPRLATFLRIAAYLKPHAWRVALVGLVSFVVTSAGLLPPLITRDIVDKVLAPQGATNGGLRLLAFYVSLLLGLRLLSWTAEWLHGSIVARLGARVTADIRSQLYRHLEMLSLKFYDQRDIGWLIARVSTDTGTLQDFLVRGLPYVLLNVLTLLGIFGLMLSMNWRLALAVAIPLPAVAAWGFGFWRRMGQLFQEWSEAGARFAGQVSESLSGIRVVKAFAQEPGEIARVDHYNRNLLRSHLKTNWNRATLLATMGLINGFGVFLLWLFGGLDVAAHRLSLGTLLAFYNYTLLFYGPLQWFGALGSWMTQAFAGAQRVFEMIDTPPEPYEDAQALPLPHAEGRITFRRVTFAYEPGRPVLHGIDLEVGARETVGLVGKSGAGKTTLINLLCRFYDINEGSIEVDGIDIRKLRLEDLRGQIGVVLQEPVLFSGTVAENIAYGRPSATLPEIIAAAKAANLHEAILAKPDGYDTEVGERGGHLSGGEKQRLSIARALLRNPRILVLDEATSAVDSETEKFIQDAIRRIAGDRTVLVIAHRLSTLRAAHRLVVLDNGRIVEVGTYRELESRRGAFYRALEASGV